jgi:hypothetical protein
MQSRKKSSATLFWVSTRDHDEDWFVFARSSVSACRFHEDYEGYNRDDAKARKVLGGIVWKEGDELPRHAQIPDLRPLGFNVLRVKPYRVVRLGGKTFKEGQLEALIEDAINKVRMKEINKKKEAVKTGEPAVN